MAGVLLTAYKNDDQPQSTPACAHLLRLSNWQPLWRICRCALLAMPFVSLPANAMSLGHVVVSFEVDVQVAGRDAAGKAFQAPPGAISKLARPASDSGAVQRTQYEGPLFQWKIQAASEIFGYEIRSKVDAPLCFRFDQARLTSNMQTKEIPMRIWQASQGHPQTPKWRIARGRGTGFVASPALCFHGKEGEQFFLAPDLSELFPSGKMFNVNWKGRDPELTERGIGNWLKIHVPIEYEGNREEWEFTLTATESRSRLLYY